MNINDYVVGTFEEEDVVYRLEENVLEYIEQNNLMDEVVMEAVDWMRGWYDDTSGDAAYEALRYSLRKVIGSKKLEELEDWEDDE